MRFIARREGVDTEVEVLRHGSGYRVRIGERWLEADLVSAGPHVRSLLLDDGTQLALTHHSSGNTHEISGSGVVKAMMPGRVVRVLVAKGDAVRKGAGLLILEAMKMENEIAAPADGTVDELFVEAGQTVESGAELLHIS